MQYLCFIIFDRWQRWARNELDWMRIRPGRLTAGPNHPWTGTHINRGAIDVMAWTSYFLCSYVLQEITGYNQRAGPLFFSYFTSQWHSILYINTVKDVHSTRTKFKSCSASKFDSVVTFRHHNTRTITLKVNAMQNDLNSRNSFIPYRPTILYDH
jgi:hypothetical protein